MSEDRKCQAKAWTLVNTGGMDAEEHTRSIDDPCKYFLKKSLSFEDKKLMYLIFNN